MHIILSEISLISFYIIKFLKIFGLNFYFLNIPKKYKSIGGNKNFINLLKKNKIFPLPIEEIQKLNNDIYLESDADINELSYKANLNLISDLKLEKMCNFFLLSKNEINILRLLLQDHIFSKVMKTNSLLKTWQLNNPNINIIYLSFNFYDFYKVEKLKNIKKIIIPINLISFIAKKILKIIFNLFKKKQKKKTNNMNLKDNENKQVAYVLHQGSTYGDGQNILFEKTLYYSDNEKSHFSKNNILHFDYSNFKNNDDNIRWFCLNQSEKKNFSSIILITNFFLKNILIVGNWKNFLALLVFTQNYVSYLKYRNSLKPFKGLKLAMIDYDFLCPKTLILALKSMNVKTVATQERFIQTFYKSQGVIIDNYLTCSEISSKIMQKSKYYLAKKFINVGQYRVDKLYQFEKSKNFPPEILAPKNLNKKIIVGLGFHTKNNWVDSQTNFLINWKAQKNYLNDMIKLSEALKNAFIILRFKSLEWCANPEFKVYLEKIEKSENITISNNYKESYYSYKLCAHSDLIIAKPTSLADESLQASKKVLIYNYTHNLNEITSGIFDYFTPSIFCNNYLDLQKKSETMLNNDDKKVYNQNEIIKKIGFINNNKSSKEIIAEIIQGKLN